MNLVIVLLIVCFVVIFVYSQVWRDGRVEAFTDLYKIPDDEFDKQYVDMYDIVWVDKDQTERIVREIDNMILSKYRKKDVKILDLGCGIGYYNNYFGLLGYSSVGVDKSKNMLRKGMMYFPKDTLIRGNMTTHKLFKEKEFTHIYVGDNVLNSLKHKDISKVLKNCYYWLKNKGYLIVNMKDVNKLDYFPETYSQFYIDDKGNKHSFTYFKNFLYDRFYLKNEDSDIYTMLEKVVLNNGKKRIIKRELTIPKREELVRLIEKNGFVHSGNIDCDNVKRGNGFDIMFFRK